MGSWGPSLLVNCYLGNKFHKKFMGQGTSRFFAQGGGGGILKSRRGIPIFFTNNMIFIECGVIALIEAFYMFRDHNHVKSFYMLNDFILIL